MLLHIVKRAEWDEAIRRGSYEPSSLPAEGFIHCSTTDQVIETANRFFLGQDDLVLLCVDERRLTATLKYEPAADARNEGPLFPHIYGPLNCDAVTLV
jgi:uncharacterized protein (DUF952 family)